MARERAEHGASLVVVVGLARQPEGDEEADALVVADEARDATAVALDAALHRAHGGVRRRRVLHLLRDGAEPLDAREDRHELAVLRHPVGLCPAAARSSTIAGTKQRSAGIICGVTMNSSSFSRLREPRPMLRCELLLLLLPTVRPVLRVSRSSDVLRIVLAALLLLLLLLDGRTRDERKPRHRGRNERVSVAGLRASGALAAATPSTGSMCTCVLPGVASVFLRPRLRAPPSSSAPRAAGGGSGDGSFGVAGGSASALARSASTLAFSLSSACRCAALFAASTAAAVALAIAVSTSDFCADSVAGGTKLPAAASS